MPRRRWPRSTCERTPERQSSCGHRRCERHRAGHGAGFYQPQVTSLAHAPRNRQVVVHPANRERFTLKYHSAFKRRFPLRRPEAAGAWPWGGTRLASTSAIGNGDRSASAQLCEGLMVTRRINVPTRGGAGPASIQADAGVERIRDPIVTRGLHKFITPSLLTAWQKMHYRETGRSAQGPTMETATAATVPMASSELEAALALARSQLTSVTELRPTDYWWAQRWIDKATPGELAAMRELLK